MDIDKSFLDNYLGIKALEAKHKRIILKRNLSAWQAEQIKKKKQKNEQKYSEYLALKKLYVEAGYPLAQAHVKAWTKKIKSK